jgi:CheY-like chemotaxis protein
MPERQSTLKRWQNLPIGYQMSVMGCRILVVDDEALICESIRMLLAYDGHRVETAGSGEEALNRFDSGEYDLVFTDFCMPGMKGDELAAAIKNRAPQKPVILLTAFPPAYNVPAIDLVITKPFYLATLREAIQTVMDKLRGK